MAGITIIKIPSLHPSFVGSKNISSNKLFIAPQSKKNAQKKFCSDKRLR